MGDLYGVASFDPFAPQALYQIDTTTGLATMIGDTGVTEITGLSFDFAQGVMYAYTTNADLYTLDLNSGAATLVGNAVQVVPEGDLAMDMQGQMFGVSGGDLGLVDMTSGAFDPLGALGDAGYDVSGLAFDASGALFGYAMNGTLDDALLQIDAGTGAATLVGPSGLNAGSAVAGMDFDPFSGEMYLSDGGSLYTLDLLSGQAGLIGGHGVTGMSGVAFIPAPSSLAVLGVLVAARRRRR
jgi:hypothetical protein